MPLNDNDRTVLESAELGPARRLEVGVELGLGVSGFHRRLNELIDDPPAVAEYPVLVGRLRRIRDRRRAARSRINLA